MNSTSNGKDKTAKVFPQEQKYSPGHPEDNKPFMKKLLWKLSEDVSQQSPWNQMSFTIYQGYQTSFSTVAQVVNEGDWRCTVRDLETMIALVFLTSNFIPKRSHNSLTCRGHGASTLQSCRNYCELDSLL